MLWSLIKIIVFVALVAALTLGAGFLIESDGSGLAEARFILFGMEYTLGPLKLVMLLILMIGVLHYCGGSTGMKPRLAAILIATANAKAIRRCPKV